MGPPRTGWTQYYARGRSSQSVLLPPLCADVGRRVPRTALSSQQPNGSRVSCGRSGHWRKAMEPSGSEATQFFHTCERPAASSACLGGVGLSEKRFELVHKNLQLLEVLLQQQPVR